MSAPHGAGDGPSPDGPRVGGVAEEALKLVEALSSWSATQDSAPHDHATAGESPECAWCPVCRALRVVRGTPPEVREHLASAASSLVQAVAALLAPPQDVVRRADEPPAEEEPQP